jgi:hypothetical protein
VTRACPGPLVWFDVTPDAAIVECARCGYFSITGSLLDEAHAAAPLLREGLA